MITLREHEDGYIYIVDEIVMMDKPEKSVSWWPLGWRAYQYKRDYGEDRIGQKMYPSSNRGNGKYMGEDGLMYTLVNGGQTVATYTETVAIPAPKTKLDTRWSNGRWYKRMSKGWVVV